MLSNKSNFILVFATFEGLLTVFIPSSPPLVVLVGCVRDRSLGTIASPHSAKLFKDLSAKTGNGDAKVMEGRNEKWERKKKRRQKLTPVPSPSSLYLSSSIWPPIMDVVGFSALLWWESMGDGIRTFLEITEFRQIPRGSVDIWVSDMLGTFDFAHTIMVCLLIHNDYISGVQFWLATHCTFNEFEVSCRGCPTNSDCWQSITIVTQLIDTLGASPNISSDWGRWLPIRICWK